MLPTPTDYCYVQILETMEHVLSCAPTHPADTKAQEARLVNWVHALKPIPRILHNAMLIILTHAAISIQVQTYW